MDGRGRIAQSLTWIARLRARPPTGGAMPRAYAAAHFQAPMPASDFQRLLQRCWIRLIRIRLPGGVGIAAAIALVLGSIGYGVVKGDHVGDVVAFLEDARDQAANAVGFNIADL